jgi:plasmid stabilization system protein ParE
VKKLRVALSDAAIADILEQSDWYETQASRNLAKRWEEAVTGTLMRIVRSPGAGAPCRFTAAELRGTRRMPVAGFAKHYPGESEILVLRVVHGARDLESLFSE